MSDFKKLFFVEIKMWNTNEKKHHSLMTLYFTSVTLQWSQITAIISPSWTSCNGLLALGLHHYCCTALCFISRGRKLSHSPVIFKKISPPNHPTLFGHCGWCSEGENLGGGIFMLATFLPLLLINNTARNIFPGHDVFFMVNNNALLDERKWKFIE